MSASPATAPARVRARNHWAPKRRQVLGALVDSSSAANNSQPGFHRGPVMTRAVAFTRLEIHSESPMLDVTVGLRAHDVVNSSGEEGRLRAEGHAHRYRQDAPLQFAPDE